MKYVILDTETTGFNSWEEQIAQLSYIILNENYEIETSKNFFFTVDSMSPGAERVHGLSIKKLHELSNGKQFKDSANEIFNDISRSTIICHNVAFDIPFINEELSRVDLKSGISDTICTMNYYTDICKIPGYYGDYKWPKLTEVLDYKDIEYSYISEKTKDIFKLEYDCGAHDSRWDVAATYEIFINGIANKGVNHG